MDAFKRENSLASPIIAAETHLCPFTFLNLNQAQKSALKIQRIFERNDKLRKFRGDTRRDE